MNEIILATYRYMLIINKNKPKNKLWVVQGEGWYTDRMARAFLQFNSVDGKIYHLEFGKRPYSAIPFNLFIRDEV